MRLSKITTRTGDKGSTGLADGTRVSKDHARITALGSVDELNSQIGVLLAESLAPGIRAVLLKIQNDLFDLGGSLALPAQDAFAENRVAWLDEQIAHYNAGLPPLREFILPGGSRAGALCHVARTLARRAERDLVALSHRNGSANGKPETRHQAVPQHALPYLNRLSDLLFVLSRCINQNSSTKEVFWER
ncbi:MAG: ATP:cob(I)alamin adenosyltransferase [Gallionellales bacterium RIFCSPLOWO2_02_FULL_57_47]|nr:MAG: ATP:cob(I)alamin adenosyltransferase [Gallionellales bacterium RIFCSPLOWO2_02_FULL_57_47]OGT14866.1 MAG: ATP:cob(I)alamin adenosyltransferase [Gallionellales bacterium RIFCSPHIGHO2_02_FULL_57_16]